MALSKTMILALSLLSSIAVHAAWNPPIEEIRATYAPKRIEPYFGKWNEKTKMRYAELRAEQIKLVDLEEKLYNTALAPSYFQSAKFRSSIEEFEKLGPPHFNKSEYENLDRKLNEIFARALKTFGTSQGPCKECESELQEVEKQWIKYRDAWANFGLARYLKSNRISWLGWQTKERLDHMNQNDVNGP